MSYGFEWIPGTVLLAAVVLLPLAPAFAMIGLLVVALAAVAALIALAGAIVATPFLVARTVHRRLVERHRPTQRSAPIGAAIAESS
jgi:hypothetical protein